MLKRQIEIIERLNDVCSRLHAGVDTLGEYELLWERKKNLSNMLIDVINSSNQMKKISKPAPKKTAKKAVKRVAKKTTRKVSKKK